MAFRFRKEGNWIKRRTHWTQMGMQPWLEDFKYRVTDFHYQFYMGPQARKALLSRQEDCAAMQRRSDLQLNGRSTKSLCGYQENTRKFYFQTFLPNVVPLRRSSNPFCRQSWNTTGWKEVYQSRRPVLRPGGEKNQVAGTDDSIPPMPKYTG